jgi:hypothetical protein
MSDEYQHLRESADLTLAESDRFARTGSFAPFLDGGDYYPEPDRVDWSPAYLFDPSIALASLFDPSIALASLFDPSIVLASLEEKALGLPMRGTFGRSLDAELHSEARAGGRHLTGWAHRRWCAIDWTTCAEWIDADRDAWAAYR